MTDLLPDEPGKPSDPIAPQQPEGRNSLLRNVFWCVVAAVGACLAYGLQAESSLFRAIALQLSLCAVAVFSAMDAVKLRQRLGENDGEDVLAEKREATAIHYLFVAAPLVAILVMAGLSMLSQLVEVAAPRSQEQVIGGAILAVMAASLWTVFGRMLQQRSQTLPEGSAVQAALSESRLAALLSAAALLAATVHPPVEGWLAWGLYLWTIAVSTEHLLRVFAAWFQPVTLQESFVAPIYSILREIFLTSLNPVAKAFDIAEARFGLSLRSSWTIRFFRRSVMPIVLSSLLLVWASTCFVVIEPQQAGLAERFGVIQRERLKPGLHTKLPWPFGAIRRYPAGIVQTMQIGFEEEADAGVANDIDRTLLWTKPHAKEFALVLGSETELVAVNAIVYFKIADDTEGFIEHALATSDPKAALESLAYRVLMEQTRSATLADVLSRGRDQFAEAVRSKLGEYAQTEKLGLDIVNVSLINIHPPVEAADSYLDVINAELDSNRVVTVAGGDAAKQILEAEQGSNGRLTEAKVEAAKRVSVAGQESAEFAAVGEAYNAAPETYRLRLWFEAFEKVLANRRLFIVDSELPDVIFDERSRSVDPALIESPQSKQP
jgi:membrane protease subunit HflK